jgi:hypothetical protein
MRFDYTMVSVDTLVDDGHREHERGHWYRAPGDHLCVRSLVRRVGVSGPSHCSWRKRRSHKGDIRPLQELGSLAG